MKPSIVPTLSESIALAYEQIKSAIDRNLTQQGYKIIEEKYHPEVFGSRYIIWLSDADAIRFMWDGREGIFVLEVTDALPLSIATAWDDITLVDYDPRTHDHQYLGIVTKEIVDSLG